jgi:uncharacterized protein (DUF1330 family)
MTAYIIANIQVANPEIFAEFQEKVPAIVEKYQGKYLARGGKAEPWEGDWKPSTLVILEFPSTDLARKFYESEDYRPLKEIRHKASKSDVIFVEGL